MSRLLESIKRDRAAAGSSPFPASFEDAIKKALNEKEQQWFKALDDIQDELVAAAESETITSKELLAKIEAASKTISNAVTLIDQHAIAQCLEEAMNLGMLLGRIQKRIQSNNRKEQAK